MHFTGFFFTGVYNHGRQEARGLGCEAGKWLVWWWSASFWIYDWIRCIHVPTVCAGLCGEPWSQSADLGSLRVCSGVCYTELGTIIPESGGEFISTLRLYGSAPASMAEYATAPFYPDRHPPQQAAAAIMLAVATVNILDVRAAIRIQVASLVAKALALTFTVTGSKLGY